MPSDRRMVRSQRLPFTGPRKASVDEVDPRYMTGNSGVRNEDPEPQLGHHRETGQRQTEVEVLRCRPPCHWAQWVIRK